ncbi:hypothetical protein J7L65_00025 [Candidatus Bathyarchaeota archaeon]|nr:hypothetical protein [Candidatus Bathyarchaeota archaeon]
MTEERSIARMLAEIDRRIIYLLLFIVVTVPILRPVAMPLAVSPDTKQYYKVLNALGPDDIVLFVLDTEFSGYMEIQSGVLASARLIIEKGAKMAIACSHPEATGIPPMMFSYLRDVMKRYDYKYGEDYVVLGYIFPNEAAVASSAQDFHGVVKEDWQGRPIKGTFLDRIHDWKDWSLIAIFSTGVRSDAFIRHYGLRGTPMVINCIGVMIPTTKPYVDTGIFKALLPSMRGGAELEKLINAPGPGLAAMDCFTFGHYLVIIFIIIANIGYFGYVRRRAER